MVQRASLVCLLTMTWASLRIREQPNAAASFTNLDLDDFVCSDILFKIKAYTQTQTQSCLNDRFRTNT